jgi:hypothetical protein
VREADDVPNLPDRHIFNQLQTLEAKAFYLRSLIRENLNLEWVIVKDPDYFTNDDLYN